MPIVMRTVGSSYSSMEDAGRNRWNKDERRNRRREVVGATYPSLLCLLIAANNRRVKSSDVLFSDMSPGPLLLEGQSPMGDPSVGIHLG